MCRALWVVVAAGCAHGAVSATIPAGQWQADGRRGIVVSGGKGAVEAGLTILQAGGNAADAAAATLLALAVTDAKNFAFGSEMAFMIRDARSGRIETLSGQGVAPALATRAFFAGQADGIPARGLLSAAVPGAPDAIVTALGRYGTRTFAEVAAPALALLDRGQEPWHRDLARTLRSMTEAERAAGGDRMRGLAAAGDVFYRGPVARAIDAFSRARGGLLRFEDLAAHRTRLEEPVSASYRGHVVWKCGAWTQGPYLLQTLQILEGFDLRAMGHNRPDFVHVVVEALKLGLADRDAFYADPRFVEVPLRTLLAPDYAARRRTLIDPAHASRELRPGDPRAAPVVSGRGGPAHDTTTCLVADAAGNVVAATPSGWSGVLVEGTGVWLGTRLQSFTLQEGHPNVILPGKRPRITLTPTIVTRDGRPVIAVSVAGGDGQDQVTLQLLLSLIDFGLSPAAAVTAPRFLTDHHIGSFRQKPAALGSLETYDSLGADTLAALRARGHAIKTRKPPLWDPTVLSIDPATHLFRGAGDPTAGRHAGAY